MSDVALAQQYTDAAEQDPIHAEERELSIRAGAGDIAAFDRIVEKYEGRILRFLYGVVGDMEVARDLCQDTFFAAYQALPRFQGDLHLSGWLHTIALNRARSHHRRRKFRVFFPIQDHEHELQSSSRDPQDTIPGDDLVRRTLARMPRQYVEVLLLQINGGLSCREISGIVGCSEGAVKVRLMRARDSFRQFYTLEGGEV